MKDHFDIIKDLMKAASSDMASTLRFADGSFVDCECNGGVYFFHYTDNDTNPEQFSVEVTASQLIALIDIHG